MSQQLQTTIDISRLTLSDWLIIASSKDNSPIWGFYGWLENSSQDWEQLTKAEVEAIADSISRPASFVWRELEGR